MKLSRARFERLAETALEQVPPAFRDRLHDLVIEVKALPGPEAGRLGRAGLLGLYVGLTWEQMRESGSTGYLPARVYLYQRNIERLADDEAGVFRQIALTLRHELAHHFGFSEAEIRLRWPEGA